MSESVPTPEGSEFLRALAVTAFENRTGNPSEEAWLAYGRWEVARAQELGLSPENPDPSKTAWDNNRFEFEKATFFFDVGGLKYAYECFEHITISALQCGDADLVIECEEMMKRIEAIIQKN